MLNKLYQTLKFFICTPNFDVIVMFFGKYYIIIRVHDSVKYFKIMKLLKLEHLLLNSFVIVAKPIGIWILNMTKKLLGRINVIFNSHILEINFCSKNKLKVKFRLFFENLLRKCKVILSLIKNKN